MNYRTMLTLTIAGAALMLGGCLRLPPTESPIPKLGANGEDAAGKTLIVMLPGMGDRAETFVAEQFLEIGQQHEFATLAVDAHFGYYRQRSLLPRLREDVVLPARAQGYEQVWLLGISLGGFGSLLYAAEHPDDIDGLILLAPYVGDDKIVRDVKAADRLADWNPDGKGFPDHEVAVWRWLQQEMANPEGKPVVLGYGSSDRLAEAYTPLVDVMDPERVYARDGNHKWTTWRPLWQDIAAALAPQQ